MSKLTKEELNGRVNDLEIDEDLKISLMEDIADSIIPDNTEEIERVTQELQSVTEELNLLKEKYKERFLNIVEEISEEVDEPEVEEKEVIDIKEI